MSLKSGPGGVVQVVNPSANTPMSQLLNILACIHAKGPDGNRRMLTSAQNPSTNVGNVPIPVGGAVSGDLVTIADNFKKLSQLAQLTADATRRSVDTGSLVTTKSSDVRSSVDTVSTVADTPPVLSETTPINGVEGTGPMEPSSTTVGSSDMPSEDDSTKDISNTNCVTNNLVPSLSVLASTAVETHQDDRHGNNQLGHKEDVPGTPTNQELTNSPKATPIGILKHTSQFDTPVSMAKVSVLCSTVSCIGSTVSCIW